MIGRLLCRLGHHRLTANPSSLTFGRIHTYCRRGCGYGRWVKG